MIDTHCHIHGATYPDDPVQALKDAQDAGVEMIINVGTDVADSQRAVEFAKQHDLVATVAQHPHDAKHLDDEGKRILKKLAQSPQVVGIGECGLDYYYEHSPQTVQKEAMRWHLQLANDINLPVSFHVRDAFEDFWTIYDEFPDTRGVIHSFSATKRELDAALERDLFVAFNGIMTFTNDEEQIEALKCAPLNRILIETDSPFLTPSPLRGTVNTPKHIPLIINKISTIKGVTAEELTSASTQNAKELFTL